MWERKIEDLFFSFPTFSFPLVETMIKADFKNGTDSAR